MSVLDQDVIAAVPLDAMPPALDYSRGDTATLGPARPALVMMTWLAVLSGLCVGSCFVVLSSQMNPLAVALHLLIYAATLALAVRGGKLLARYGAPSLRSPALPWLDLLAGIGLLIIAVSPFMFDMRSGPEEFAMGCLGVAFSFICLSTPRHLILYRGLARLVVDATGRYRLARWLTVLGWIKFVYEGLWLLCCCVPLLMVAALGKNLGHDYEGAAVFMAFGALFGAAGFTVVWIMMMITHGRLAALSRPQRPIQYTGPEFNARPVPPPEAWAIEARQP